MSVCWVVYFTKTTVKIAHCSLLLKCMIGPNCIEWGFASGTNTSAKRKQKTIHKNHRRMVSVVGWGSRSERANGFRSAGWKVLELHFTAAWAWRLLNYMLQNGEGVKFYALVFLNTVVEKDKCVERTRCLRLSLWKRLFPWWYHRPRWFVNFLEQKLETSGQHCRLATHLRLGVIPHEFMRDQAERPLVSPCLTCTRFSKQSPTEGSPSGKISKAFIISLTAPFSLSVPPSLSGKPMKSRIKRALSSLPQWPVAVPGY